MKWKKLGKIFDPTHYTLANHCVEFAQAPQALVFDDFVRIYFSTRQVDENGKYLSHISFVDFNKTFGEIRRVSDNTVIPLGDLGCYDEHGIFPLNILRKEDKIYAYVSGINRRVSVSVDSSIGLAISSNNGLTFEKYGAGPILTSSLFEPFLVCDPFVANFEKMYHMWYVFGEKWIRGAELDGTPSRVYKIAHATSDDGISWHKEGKQVITDKLDLNECQALPTVIHMKDKYYMFFCYRYATNFRKDNSRSYRIGFAYSKDLWNWTRDDENSGIQVSKQGWDSEMLCYPHVFHCNDKVYMLYNGNEFGRFGFGLAELQN